MRTVIWWVAAFVLLILVVDACSDGEADEPEPEPATVEDTADPQEDDGPEIAAELACVHFINTMVDARDGILTYAEVREKLREVEVDARTSDEPGIADGARELLAAATAGESLQAPTDRLIAACEDAGAIEPPR